MSMFERVSTKYYIKDIVIKWQFMDVAFYDISAL